VDKWQLFEALKGNFKDTISALCGKVVEMSRDNLEEGVLEYLLELERGKREG
jgi:hypothetical protein